MKYRNMKARAIAVAIASILGATTLTLVDLARAHIVIDESGQAQGPSVATVDRSEPARYIVRFKELPLALYDGHMPGLASIPRTTDPGRRAKLDTHSAAAAAYVSYLKSTQAQHTEAIRSHLGHDVEVERAMQHALNAIVVKLTVKEAKNVTTLDGIAAVTRDRYQQLTTDIGPGFLGAANVWWGAKAGVDTLFASGFEVNLQYRGEGVVIADIDTGYNSNSDSFAGTDDSGYVFLNPLGSGNYLGLCNPSSSEQPSTIYGVSFAGCNPKVIGAYDFVDSSAPFSTEDYQGHGSHTASTAGGNTRTASIGTYTARISGIAPHANLIFYYSCGFNGCLESATASAVDQAIQDSVVDSLNYSISGGTDPWNEPTSLAFLSAADSGIFIAAAAGNTTTSAPDATPGTANHLEPWVTTVAAANHSGGPLGYYLTFSGVGAPIPVGVITAPASTQPSAPMSSGIAISPNFDAANDCAALPNGTFAAKMAVMHFVNGPCIANTLAANALAAGATSVLVVNSSNDYIYTAAAQPLPIFTTTSVQGSALVAFVNSNTNVTANISYPANSRLSAIADSLASFSLLGPATFDVIKPDVQAPGTTILAAFNSATPFSAALGADNVAFDNGTSMATPHIAGSAALLVGLHPDWTPMEVKSALMMTAKEAGLTKPDHSTVSDFYDRGSGSIRDDVAANAGLVLNETGLDFLQADPSHGGDPKSLNLASMQDSNCVTKTGTLTSTPSCTFTRRFRSTQASSVTWSAELSGMNGTVTPSSFDLAAHGVRSLSISIDASSYAANGSPHFGELVLTPSDPKMPFLHLPIAISLQQPTIVTAPSPLIISIPSGSTTHGSHLSVSNFGGAPLIVTETNDSTSMFARYVVLDQPSKGDAGFYSDYFVDAVEGIYLAEDFQTLAASTNLTKLTFPGFNVGSPLAGNAGKKVHFDIYADNSGKPNGNPETVAPSYLYHYVATIGATNGLSVAGGTISIDLQAASAPATALPPGRYWVVVYPDLNYATSRWAWFDSATTFGNNAYAINPKGSFSFGTGWTDVTDPAFGVTYPGMALHIEANVSCGATWLSTTPSNLSLPGLTGGAVTVTADSTHFPVPGAGIAKGIVCIDSNDANFPVLAVPVITTQD